MALNDGAGLMVKKPDGTYEQIMPIIVCSSRGGTYDDKPFLAGFDLGVLYFLMQMAANHYAKSINDFNINKDLIPQVDLFAMYFNLDYTIKEIKDNAQEVLVSAKRKIKDKLL